MNTVKSWSDTWRSPKHAGEQVAARHLAIGKGAWIVIHDIDTWFSLKARATIKGCPDIYPALTAHAGPKTVRVRNHAHDNSGSGIGCPGVSIFPAPNTHGLVFAPLPPLVAYNTGRRQATACYVE